MFKRVFWFTTGATAGFGGAMWIRRQVLRTVRRFTPEQVQVEVTTSVRRLGTDLRAAVSEARDAMAEREAALRSELTPGAGPAEAHLRVGPPGPASPGAPAWGARPAAQQHPGRGVLPAHQQPPSATSPATPTAVAPKRSAASPASPSPAQGGRPLRRREPARGPHPARQ